jgi:hypothetical protein
VVGFAAAAHNTVPIDPQTLAPAFGESGVAVTPAPLARDLSQGARSDSNEIARRFSFDVPQLNLLGLGVQPAQTT